MPPAEARGVTVDTWEAHAHHVLKARDGALSEAVGVVDAHLASTLRWLCVAAQRSLDHEGKRVSHEGEPAKEGARRLPHDHILHRGEAVQLAHIDALP
eukprot:scaffold63983_cov60-Phaeocystis_antarctica.AAC.2